MSQQEILYDTVSSHVPSPVSHASQPSSLNIDDNRSPLEAGRIKIQPAFIGGVMHDLTEAGKETLRSATSVAKGLMEGNVVRISLDQVDNIAVLVR